MKKCFLLLTVTICFPIAASMTSTDNVAQSDNHNIAHLAEYYAGLTKKLFEQPYFEKEVFHGRKRETRTKVLPIPCANDAALLVFLLNYKSNQEKCVPRSLERSVFRDEEIENGVIVYNGIDFEYDNPRKDLELFCDALKKDYNQVFRSIQNGWCEVTEKCPKLKESHDTWRFFVQNKSNEIISWHQKSLIDWLAMKWKLTEHIRYRAAGDKITIAREDSHFWQGYETLVLKQDLISIDKKHFDEVHNAFQFNIAA